MKPIRVLHIGKYYPPVWGGIERHVRDVCEGLVRSGVEASCIAFSRSKWSSFENRNGVPLLRVGKLLKRLPPISLTLPFHLWKAQRHADIVHLHMPNPCAEMGCLLTRPKRLVVTYHADIVGKRGAAMYLPLQRKLLRLADEIIVSSEEYKTSSRMLRGLQHKCIVIPFGVDAAPFQDIPAERIATLRSTLPGPVFLYVGRLVHYKGLPHLIDAMASTEGTLIIAGTGPLHQTLRNRVQKRGIANRVRFLSRVSEEDLPALYAAADVVVLPSINRAEAFGYVQLEAMAAGKPVISTRLGTGVDVINQHCRTGLIVPPGDSRALAGAMTALGGVPMLRKRLGSAGKARVQAQFSSQKMISRTLKIYKRVLETR